MDIEIWKPVVGYEGFYEVSNLGRVKTLHYNRLLKPNKDKYGYYKVSLRLNGKSKSYTVHRLVAMAFVDNPYNKPCVGHKDETKTNNFASNLEWVTWAENDRMPLHRKRISEHCNWRGKGALHNCSKAVLQFDKKGNFITEFVSTQEAERITGIAHQSIGQCCLKRKYKSAGGFVWKYKIR